MRFFYVRDCGHSLFLSLEGVPAFMLKLELFEWFMTNKRGFPSL